VALNRAVAHGLAHGPQTGLAQLDALEGSALPQSHLVAAARAELSRRAGDAPAARVAYEAALATVRNDAERRYLKKRLASL